MLVFLSLAAVCHIVARLRYAIVRSELPPIYIQPLWSTRFSFRGGRGHSKSLTRLKKTGEVVQLIRITNLGELLHIAYPLVRMSTDERRRWKIYVTGV